MSVYTPSMSYLRVAAACPEVALGNPEENARRIAEVYKTAAQRGASLVVLPEMSLTGCTIGDLVYQTSLLNRTKAALLQLAELTRGRDCALVVGLPYEFRHKVYNCAAFLAGGEVAGLSPSVPYDNEYVVPDVTPDGFRFGTVVLYRLDGAVIEVITGNGAPSANSTVVVNLAASPEIIGASKLRRERVKTLSSSLISGYVYASAGAGESTDSAVMSGHLLVAENGKLLAERLPFSGENLMFADIDLEHIAFDRRSEHFALPMYDAVPIWIKRTQTDVLAKIERNPFLPDEPPSERTERFEEMLAIQTEALYCRMLKTGLGAVVALSGGLDSTLALLVMVRAAQKLGKPESVHALIMPGPASSEQTQSNAVKLAQGLGVTHFVRPIESIVNAELTLLGHEANNQNVTYENAQARVRMMHPLNYGNENGMLVVNTSDLSEAALGWSTYGGDQFGSYGVNLSVPKTMLREAIRYFSQRPEYAAVGDVLADIVATPISPELTNTGAGITQLTEDKIGPYELHDFFLYYSVRFGDTPDKIAYLAKLAFAGEYDGATIDKWLSMFLNRFRANQFKRDAAPNGPQVSEVSLSRGGWHMPSDL